MYSSKTVFVILKELLIKLCGNGYSLNLTFYNPCENSSRLVTINFKSRIGSYFSECISKTHFQRS